MNDEYNSILKEKKVYEDPEIEHPMTKKFVFLGICLSFVIIIICYVIYYNTVLSSDVILLNNLKMLTDKYSNIFTELLDEYDLDNNYMLDGTVKVDSLIYNYTFIKDNNMLKRTIYNDDTSITYYYDSDTSYVKLEDDYIELNDSLYNLDDYDNKLDNIQTDIFAYFYNSLLDSSVTDMTEFFYNIDNLNSLINNLSSNYSNNIDNYTKNFYVNGRPLVEVSLVLDKDDVNTILGNGNNNLMVTDDITVTITTKNDAIMNSIISIKVVITNNDTDVRTVFNYDGENIEYTDESGVTNKIVLSDTDSGYSLKLYKDDILYSVLEKTYEDSIYTYNYQVIDEKYKITVYITKEEDVYTYNFVSNINDKTNNIEITLKYTDDGAIEEDISNVILNKDIDDNIKNTLNNSIKNILFGT